VRSPVLYLYHLFNLSQVFRRQWQGPAALRAYQDGCLRRVVARAHATVPYYRRLMDRAGVRPKDVRCAADLARLPITTKGDILANFPEGILSSARREGHYRQSTTSGSSGWRMPVYCDTTQLALFRLMELRQLWDLGYRPRDLMAYMRPEAPKGRHFQRLGLFRRAFVSILEPVERQAEALLRVRPQVVYVYPSSIYQVARELDGASARGLKLKFILSNSELLAGEVRAYLEDKFGCRVYDDYSCLEFQAIGFECRHQRLHQAADNAVVEVVDAAGRPLPPGEPGRLILTALHNFVMPYLRYDIGDVGALGREPCACGRGFPVIEGLAGRQDDFIVAANGELLNPRVVCRPFRASPALRQFQILQQADGAVTVRVAPSAQAGKGEAAAQAREAARGAFPEGMRVSVEVTDQIETGAAGKHRAVRSLALAPGAEKDIEPGTARMMRRGL